MKNNLPNNLLIKGLVLKGSKSSMCSPVPIKIMGLLVAATLRRKWDMYLLLYWNPLVDVTLMRMTTQWTMYLQTNITVCIFKILVINMINLDITTLCLEPLVSSKKLALKCRDNTSFLPQGIWGEDRSKPNLFHIA